jgi:hypothetical protein
MLLTLQKLALQTLDFMRGIVVCWSYLNNRSCCDSPPMPQTPTRRIAMYARVSTLDQDLQSQLQEL